MSVHSEINGRWLSNYGRDAAPGSEHTSSIGHPLCGGQFTTYRLGPVVMLDDRGEPLFDLEEAEIQMPWPDNRFFPAARLRAIQRELKTTFANEFHLDGITYGRSVFFDSFNAKRAA